MNKDVRADVLAWRFLVESEAQRPRLRDSLVLSLIARESRGISTAVGRDEDIGLMQVTRPAWQDYQTETNDPDTVIFPDSMLDPALCIRVGSWFLDRKIAEMGGDYDGLRAYNRGAAGAAASPTAGADYARWILAHESEFTSAVV